MFPIRDDNPQLHKPVATYAIIGLNAAAWLLLQGMGAGDQLNMSVCQYGLIPADLFSATASNGPCRDYGLGWPALLSSMFMHGSWMHILGNMWFMWIFGGNVEDSMGPVRFTLFYLFSGLLAATAQILAGPASTIPMVGASGAIGGVMGAYIMLFPKVKVHMLVFFMVFRVPAVAMLGYWIVVQLIGGVSSIGATGGGVAFWAHVGGFAAGAALVWVFKDEELLLNHPYRGWNQEVVDPASIWRDPKNRQ